MPHVYCPFSTCASKVTYEITKPTSCPKCQRAFADAFKTVVAAPTPPQVRRPGREEPLDDRPLTRSALEASQKARKAAVAGARPVPAAEDEDQDDVDPREARRAARELAASIDTSSMLTEVADDRVISGMDLWNEGAASRAKSVAKKAAKSKARR
jgi:hypothetical protein